MLKKVLISSTVFMIGIYATAVNSAGQNVKFSMADVNSDGKVTAAEWAKQTKGQSGAIKYSDLDMDKNGGVTEKEFNLATKKSMMKKY